MERSPDRGEQERRFPRRPLLPVASDERLAQEVRLGNEAAFEVIYRRHSSGLLALCRHILGSRDEAEEALQQSFASAWSDLQRPDRPPPDAMKPWLFAIARHRCLSMLRVRRPSTVELDELPTPAGLSDEVGRRADLRALLADVHDLPEEQKTALVLAELGGLSHGDIADVLGRETAGVKMLIFQARTTLGAWREAREASCAEIRQQLSVLRGGSLRRRPLRRHLQACADCRAFRAELRAQRRGLAIVLPVLPSLGLREGVLGMVGIGTASSAGAAGGGLLGAGAAVGLGVPALVPLGSAVATVATVAALAGGSGPLVEAEDPDKLSRSPAQAGTPGAASAAAHGKSRSTRGERPGWSGDAGPRPGSASPRPAPPRDGPRSISPAGSSERQGHGSDPGQAGPGPELGERESHQSGSQPHTTEDHESKITKADREANGEGPDAQRKAEEKKAKAREERKKKVSEAEEKRAEPRRELDEEIEERDMKVADAFEE